jgi:glycosyltransferase involved in cell wall biosynthesis
MRNNILFLLNSLVMGGTEKKAINIANEMHKKNYNIFFGYLNHPEELLDSLNNEIPNFNLYRQKKYDFSAINKYNSITKQTIFNFTIFFNLYPFLFHRLSKISMNGSTVTKNFVSINTSIMASLKEKLQMLIYKPLLRDADLLIFGSTAQERLWKRKYNLGQVSSTVIYNGVDTNYFSPSFHPTAAAHLRSELKIDDRELILGNVASFRPEKNHDFLIDGLETLLRIGIPAQLILVGDGPERSRIEQRVQKRGLLRQVHFLGMMKDVRQALSLMDIFVLPSSAVETFSNAALEALSMGIPVMLSDIGGAREMIIDGEHGFVFPPNDLDSFIRGIQFLYRESNHLKMRAHCRMRVQVLFSIDAMVNRYQDLVN